MENDNPPTLFITLVRGMQIAKIPTPPQVIEYGFVTGRDKDSPGHVLCRYWQPERAGDAMSTKKTPDLTPIKSLILIDSCEQAIVDEWLEENSV